MDEMLIYRLAFIPVIASWVLLAVSIYKTNKEEAKYDFAKSLGIPFLFETKAGKKWASVYWLSVILVLSSMYLLHSVAPLANS